MSCSMQYLGIIAIFFCLVFLFQCFLPNISGPANLQANMRTFTNPDSHSGDKIILDAFTDYEAGKLIVKLRSDVTEDARCRLGPSLSELNQMYGLKGVTPLFPMIDWANRKKTSSFIPGRGLYLFHFDEDISVNDLAEVYTQNPQVEFAVPDYKIIWPIYDRCDSSYDDEILIDPDNYIPNDPYLDRQWGLEKIQVFAAWNETKGSEDVIVVIIDSGVDRTHEDLVDNMWINQNEIPENGIDDDGNGYVDDDHGLNLIDPGTDPMDVYGHGTSVATIIGAVGDNGLGIAGIAWNVKIMAVKFMEPEQETTLSEFISNAIKAIKYSIMMGADIINASWGFAHFSVSLREFVLYHALGEVIHEAEEAGILFVAAVGNDSVNIEISPVYPACYELSNIISVVAADWNDGIAHFSNHGPRSADIAAPGVRIISAVPGDAYEYQEGTSMAAPFVTAVAVLIKAKYPNISLRDLKARILERADQISALEGSVCQGRRLNAYKSLVDPSKKEIRVTPVLPWYMRGFFPYPPVITLPPIMPFPLPMPLPSPMPYPLPFPPRFLPLPIAPPRTLPAPPIILPVPSTPKSRILPIEGYGAINPYSPSFCPSYVHNQSLVYPLSIF